MNGRGVPAAKIIVRRGQKYFDESLRFNRPDGTAIKRFAAESVMGLRNKRVNPKKAPAGSRLTMACRSWLLMYETLTIPDIKR